MKVSVVIPIYNVAPYITRCLQSVTAQSCQEIECLLIDDCSTDESMQITESFLSTYKGSIQFSIIHHQQNQGPSISCGAPVTISPWT